MPSHLAKPAPSGRRRLGPLATLGVLTMVAVIAVIAVGCSKAPDTAAGGATPNGADSTSAQAQAVKFSECMRDHGISDFPDPDASGQLTIDAVSNSSVDINTAAFSQAIAACKGLEPAGFTGQKRDAQQQVAALEFAQCVRDNGVPDFPDPGPNDPLIDTNRIPSTAQNGGMSILNAAMRKCSDDAKAAGVTGPK